MAAVLAPTPSSALVIKNFQSYTQGQTNPNSNLINASPPGNGLTFANQADNRTGIYLGDQWFLTATHAQPGGSNPSGAVRIAGVDFPVISGSAVVIANSGGGIDATSDLLMYRIGLDAQGRTPEDVNSAIKQIVIADTLAGTGTVLTMVGRGRTRFLNPNNTQTGTYQFDSNGVILSSGTGAYEGFLVANNTNSDWHWGQNRRFGGVTTFGVDGAVNDTRGFKVRFDKTDLLNEAQGINGDSGGPVFWNDNGEWVLAGLHHVIFSPSNNCTGGACSNLLTAYGAQTGISDLSNLFYRNQIAGLRGQAEYSLLGDLDLDGAVTGEIVAGVATGDLGILVDNWLYSAPQADLKTWVRGDINQDGITDLGDFVLMRDALGGVIDVAQFTALVSGAHSTPEPSAVLLAAGATLAATRRRRR